jgi:hypothetical protein
MLRLLKRIDPARATHANAGSPLDRLISLWLVYAKEENATAIVIGMPREIPASVSGENEAEFRRLLAEDGDLEARASNDEALMASSRLRSVAGWPSVPVWMERDGRLYPAGQGPPIEFHLALLSMIQERLVSLGASEDAPKPMRYIEYDSDDAAHRCFAEVELLWGKDNTLRIAVLGHVREPASVRAVGSVY